MRELKRVHARVPSYHVLVREQARSILKGETALFLGAGISANSGLPVASELVSTILDELPLSRDVRHSLDSSGVPFEYLMEILSRCGSIRPLIELFRQGTPNANHRLVASLASTGVVRTICTTNFDVLLEAALEYEGLRKGREYTALHRHRSSTSARSSGPRRIHLMKLHGSAHDLESVAITLRMVARRDLSLARRSVITHLFGRGPHRRVLILGYSCSDVFDLVPQIKAVPRPHKTILIVQHDRSPARTQVKHLYRGSSPFAAYPGCELKCDTDSFVRDLSAATGVATSAQRQTRTTHWVVSVKAWSRGSSTAAKHVMAADLLRLIGAYKASLKHLGIAQRHLRENVDRRLECKAAHDHGLTRRAMGANASALEHLEVALRIARAIKDPKLIANLLGDIGSIHRLVGDYQRALRYQKKAMATASRARLTLLLGRLHSNIGNTLHMLGDYRGAITHHRKAVEVAIRAGDKGAEALSTGNLGSAELMLNWDAKAEGAFNRALRIAREVGNRRIEATNLANLADAYERRGMMREAVKTYQAALRIAAAGGMGELIAPIQQSLKRAADRERGRKNDVASVTRVN